MPRGRPQSVDDDRLLIELLIHPDRAVFTPEIATAVDVTNQTIRERMDQLESEGLVEIQELSGNNLYRLSEDGMAYLRELLRSDYH